jgi:hypothetical protein
MEIEGYINDSKTGKPVDKNDHSMTAIKYMILADPRHEGGSLTKENLEMSTAHPYTGYHPAGSKYS